MAKYEPRIYKLSCINKEVCENKAIPCRDYKCPFYTDVKSEEVKVIKNKQSISRQRKMKNNETVYILTQRKYSEEADYEIHEFKSFTEAEEFLNDPDLELESKQYSDIKVIRGVELKIADKEVVIRKEII